MRIILLLLSVFASLASAGQKIFCLAPSCKQTVNAGDSVLVFAQLTTSDGYGSISWKQASGPTIPLPAQQVTPISSLQGQSSLTLKNLQPGTYIFNVAGTSATGVSGVVQDTVVVNASARRIAYVVTVYTDSTRIKNQ